MLRPPQPFFHAGLDILAGHVAQGDTIEGDHHDTVFLPDRAPLPSAHINAEIVIYDAGFEPYRISHGEVGHRFFLASFA